MQTNPQRQSWPAAAWCQDSGKGPSQRSAVGVMRPSERWLWWCHRGLEVVKPHGTIPLRQGRFTMCQRLPHRLVCSGGCGFWGAHTLCPSQASFLSPGGPHSALAGWKQTFSEEETHFSSDLPTTTKPQSPQGQPAGLGSWLRPTPQLSMQRGTEMVFQRVKQRSLERSESLTPQDFPGGGEHRLTAPSSPSFPPSSSSPALPATQHEPRFRPLGFLFSSLSLDSGPPARPQKPWGALKNSPPWVRS